MTGELREKHQRSVFVIYAQTFYDDTRSSNNVWYMEMIFFFFAEVTRHTRKYSTAKNNDYSVYFPPLK